ncbi:conserved hypothetical protein [Rhodobacteraceae bacterium KLH11]|nr:conserved hypothetical protein [Rhodobacteraceae bacterium KLH11]
MITVCAAIVLLYLSRFWIFDLWGRPGLFGLRSLPPGGNLVARWVRGTPLAQFDLIIWVCGVFLVLTWLEKLYHQLTHKDA